MANDEDHFRIRPGRVRDRAGGRTPRAVRPRPKTFLAQVHQAIRRAGGDPNRLGSAGKGSGRFNARGRGGDDRHQFCFIVSAEDGVELADLRETTRDLMKAMEADLGTKLDWIAVDHHNTGHPHTHILLRGATDEGKTLNIAGDYIAHGIRERASEIVTLELGRQTEQEVSRQLEREVDAERFTRLDRMLIAEQEASHGFADLRPDQDMMETARRNRALLIARARRLKSMGLATEVEVGRWSISAQTEPTLRELGERGDIIKTMHRALADNGLADERAPGQYVAHGKQITEPIVGRVLAKGLAGDEMGDRLHLVIDGVDGRTHYVEMADAGRIDEIRRGHIVALDPAPTKAEPRPADVNIQIMAETNGGIYQPSLHLEATRDIIEQRHGDPDAFIRSHVRRLEALRRAGHVERIDADHWKIPGDIAERGIAYDAPAGPRISASAHCPRSTSTGRLAATAQPGSTGSWLRKTTCPLPGPASAGR